MGETEEPITNETQLTSLLISDRKFRPYHSNQDFHQLRKELLESGKLFEDPEFLAQDSSVYFSKTPSKPVVWKRPTEIVTDPRFLVDGASRFDIKQGRLGDCWLMSGIQSLTLNPTLFEHVVPSDQKFVENYAGIFHFRFWWYGSWINVVIDDRLPVDGENLIFLHSSNNDEFWSALFEKAYAKLHGSYEALSGGCTLESMVDFSGGVSELFKLQPKAQPGLDKILLKAYQRSAFIGVSTDGDAQSTTIDGLVTGHSYCISKVQYVDVTTSHTSGKILLVRIRNPWGNAVEWKGAWSDKSQEWKFISDENRANIGLTIDHDGEFWMSFHDVVKHFTKLFICSLNPDGVDEGTKSTTGTNAKRWEIKSFDGEWVRGVSAGGCIGYLETFATNPQYIIELKEPDEDEEDNQCTVIVALTQKFRRSMMSLGAKNLSIGYAIFKVSEPVDRSKPFDEEFFSGDNDALPHPPPFSALKEVCFRYKLPPGCYCIVPSTFKPGEEGEFYLRIFSENKAAVEANDPTKV